MIDAHGTKASKPSCILSRDTARNEDKQTFLNCKSGNSVCISLAAVLNKPSSIATRTTLMPCFPSFLAKAFPMPEQSNPGPLIYSSTTGSLPRNGQQRCVMSAWSVFCLRSCQDDVRTSKGSQNSWPINEAHLLTTASPCDKPPCCIVTFLKILGSEANVQQKLVYKIRHEDET